MSEVTADMRLLAVRMRQDFDDARQRRQWAKQHVSGPKYVELMHAADRFDKAGLSRAVELGALIEACFQKAEG